MTHLSPSALSIIASFRAAFAALDDHRSQPERDLVYAVVASHLRSAAPMALLGSADTLAPITEARIPLGDGAFVELSAPDGRLSLYLHDSTGSDAAAPMTLAQAHELWAVLARVR